MIDNFNEHAANERTSLSWVKIFSANSVRREVILSVLLLLSIAVLTGSVWFAARQPGVAS